MDNIIQPSAEEYHAVYAASFTLWSRLCRRASSRPTLPPHASSLSGAFAQFPSLQPNLKIHYEKTGLNRVYTTGLSEWASPLLGCQRGMSSFRHPVEVTLSAKAPIALSFDQSQDKLTYFQTWFHQHEENYISLLMLAWAYILSARWAGMMPAKCCLTYTDSQAPERATKVHNVSHRFPEVFIETSSPAELRWWAAVLAPTQGWEAKMTMDGDELFSPWSYSLMDSPGFILSRKKNTQLKNSRQNLAATSTEALRFLESFCLLHGIQDQSLAALSAVLLLPSQRTNKELVLPAPVIRNEPHQNPTRNKLVFSDKAYPCGDVEPHQRITLQDLDRFLTLSCYTRGTSCMLLSPLYESGVLCNQAGPWLQGAIDVMLPLATHEPWILANIFSDRIPAVAPLWVGATILGLSAKLMGQASYGQIRVDLNTAAWSSTVQSFIQEPISEDYGGSELISRADECRLLFLTQAENHSHTPIGQWAPFGATPITETDIDVRLHKDCGQHSLRYEAFIWDCTDGERRFELPPGTSFDITRSKSLDNESVVYEQGIPSPSDLPHSKEFISKSATESIFGWLRWYGFASHETQLRDHEWFEMVGYQSSSEDELEEKSPKSKPKSLSRVSSWVEALYISSSNTPHEEQQFWDV